MWFRSFLFVEIFDSEIVSLVDEDVWFRYFFEMLDSKNVSLVDEMCGKDAAEVFVVVTFDTINAKGNAKGNNVSIQACAYHGVGCGFAMLQASLFLMHLHRKGRPADQGDESVWLREGCVHGLLLNVLNLSHSGSRHAHGGADSVWLREGHL